MGKVLLTRSRPATGAWRWSRAVIAVLFLGSLAPLAGCGSEDESADASATDERGVLVLEVDAPLRSPLWSSAEEEILALREDGRSLAKVSVGRGGFNPDAEQPRAIASFQRLEGTAGENLALEGGVSPDKIYVPIPDRDEVYVSEKDDLLEVRTFDVGKPPVRVALDRGSYTLFALSQDGSTVAVADVQDWETLAEVDVEGHEGSLIEASAEGGFWVTRPEAVAFYEGPSFQDPASVGLEASALAADTSRPGRAYVAEAGDAGRVVTLEPVEGRRLEVVAEAKVDGPVDHLAAEEGRLYAVTPDSVVVLDPENLKRRESVNFDEALGREALKKAEPSGVAVGEDNFYLTLDGEPFLMQIGKT